MKRIIILFLCMILLSGCTAKDTVLQGFSMDASYRIQGKEISKETETTIKTYLQNIDSIFNAYQNDSYLSRLNHHKKLTIADRDSGEGILYDVLEKTLPYCNQYFDVSIRPISKLWDFQSETPTVPALEEISTNLKAVDYRNIVLEDDFIVLENNAEIELGAVAKGYVCDWVSNQLTDTVAIVDIGGTVKTIGKNITAGIKSPDHDGVLCAFTLMDGQAVATSGTYERSFTDSGTLYHHILNPKTGMPVDSPYVSVSVIGDSALVCDILSTTYFATDDPQIPDGIDAIFVTKDKQIYATEGILNLKTLNTDYTVLDYIQE